MKLTKHECLGSSERWKANEERLKSNKLESKPLPKICDKALRRLERAEEKAKSKPSYADACSHGAMSNPFYGEPFLNYVGYSGQVSTPYLNKQHQNFDDTIVSIVRSFHSDKSIETHPKEALDLRKVYTIYRHLPFFNVQSIMNELGVNQRQAYLYLELVRIANTLLGRTTNKVMPIIPSYSDKDTRNYSAYKKRNKDYFTKKIWWLINHRFATQTKQGA